MRAAVVTTRTEAEVLARAIEIGALSVADAVEWADRVVEGEDHPHWTVCEVAMSGRKYEPNVVAALREVPGSVDEGEVRRGVVRILATGLTRSQARRLDCPVPIPARPQRRGRW